MSKIETTFEESAVSPGPENQQAAPPNAAGFILQPIDVEAAFRILDQLDDFDPAEQRETFEYLKRALNEDRAAGGERLLFP